MIKFHNPSTIGAPASRYSHGAEAGPGARWLHVSGQVGVDPSGKILPGIEAQTERAFRNVEAILKSAGMGFDDVVKINTFLLTRDDVPVLRTLRDRMFTKTAPASTLFMVAALAHPDWLVEIEAVAARQD
ncbi:MAG: RidA family protein [Alphaproteobacteria bacterium]|nr:RidA family protein [Alphaproteobacteria bacterium]